MWQELVQIDATCRSHANDPSLDSWLIGRILTLFRRWCLGTAVVTNMGVPTIKLILYSTWHNCCMWRVCWVHLEAPEFGRPNLEVTHDSTDVCDSHLWNDARYRYNCNIMFTYVPVLHNGASIQYWICIICYSYAVHCTMYTYPCTYVHMYVSAPTGNSCALRHVSLTVCCVNWPLSFLHQTYRLTANNAIIYIVRWAVCGGMIVLCYLVSTPLVSPTCDKSVMGHSACHTSIVSIHF